METESTEGSQSRSLDVPPSSEELGTTSEPFLSSDGHSRAALAAATSAAASAASAAAAAASTAKAAALFTKTPAPYSGFTEPSSGSLLGAVCEGSHQIGHENLGYEPFYVSSVSRDPYAITDHSSSPVPAPGSSSDPVTGSSAGPILGSSSGPILGSSSGPDPWSSSGPVPGSSFGPVPGSSFSPVSASSSGPAPGSSFGPVPVSSFGPVSGSSFGPIPGSSFGPIPGSSFGPIPGSSFGPVPHSSSSPVSGSSPGPGPGSSSGPLPVTSSGTGHGSFPGSSSGTDLDLVHGSRSGLDHGSIPVSGSAPNQGIVPGSSTGPGHGSISLSAFRTGSGPCPIPVSGADHIYASGQGSGPASGPGPTSGAGPGASPGPELRPNTPQRFRKPGPELPNYTSWSRYCHLEPQKQPPWEFLQVSEPGARGLRKTSESEGKPKFLYETLPRGQCLLYNWEEERATNHLDKVPSWQDGSESFFFRHGHRGLLTLQPHSPMPSSTTQDSYQPPRNLGQPLRGKREAMLEMLLHYQICKEVQAEQEPIRKPFEVESVTHHDYQIELVQAGPPAPTKPHDYRQEQPETFWKQRAPQLPGVSNIRTLDTPFRKNCSFSTPVPLSLGQPLPYELENYPDQLGEMSSLACQGGGQGFPGGE